MSEPDRSAALSRALAEEDDGLSPEFAARVAALAEAETARPCFSWADVALLGAFVAMLAVCVGGWFAFGGRDMGSSNLAYLSWRELMSQPWLITGIAGLALVQLLTFRRRART
jgi:hypothetical protein